MQSLAEYYKEAGFLKTYGNVSEAAKYLFKERLKARVTPTFYFFRNGETCWQLSWAASLYAPPSSICSFIGVSNQVQCGSPVGYADYVRLHFKALRRVQLVLTFVCCNCTVW